MKRNLYDKLRKWKDSSAGKTALMIDGARRVGKSWIVEEFAKREYPAYLVIDFANVPKKVKTYFNEELIHLDRFFMLLFSAYHVNMLPKGSLLVFDEVQRFPRAREAIKYLVKDGRYHYIETGSLISINRNVKDIVIPSEERHLKMFPMDFGEFLEATGRLLPYSAAWEAFERRVPVEEGIHRELMAAFREYLVVGGMPQAVVEFVASHDLGRVDSIKRDILALYRGDIMKFGGVQKHKVMSIFNSIPSQLSRHEKRFNLQCLGKSARMRNCEASFEWLASAMTVNVCYGSSDPNVGLELNADRLSLKCYLGDTGLLVSQAFGESDLQREAIHDRLLSDRIEINAGMLVENAVAQMLRAAGHELYFYSRYNREDAGQNMEIDFLVDKPGLTRRHNISPVEVKSSREYTTTSLDRFRERFSSSSAQPYVLHEKNLSVVDGVVRLPLYMTPWLVTGGPLPK